MNKTPSAHFEYLAPVPAAVLAAAPASRGVLRRSLQSLGMLTGGHQRHIKMNLSQTLKLCGLCPVLGMSLRKVTSSLLGSNLASATDLKRIQTPHNLFCDFGGYKTFTTRRSGGRVQLDSEV